jgi:hypothetical protein
MATTKFAEKLSSQDEDKKRSPKPVPEPYSAFSPPRRRLILGLVTTAGFFGPLAGTIYLPALTNLSEAFGVGITEINVTVTVFMAVLTFGVSPTSQIASMKSCTNDADPRPAPLLVKFRRLEGPASAVPHLAFHLRPRQRTSCRGADWLRCIDRSADIAGIWLIGCHEPGSWYRRRCESPPVRSVRIFFNSGVRIASRTKEPSFGHVDVLAWSAVWSHSWTCPWRLACRPGGLEVDIWVLGLVPYASRIFLDEI